MKISLEMSQEFRFFESDLSILIHGEEHAGASLFTVSVVADLYSQGSKILFLSGYPMAREEFLKQTDDANNFVLGTGNEKPDELQKSRAIFLLKESSDFFVHLMRALPDISERVVLVKNIELFEEKVFDAVKDINKVIISGNLGKCACKESVLKKDFATKIFFSTLVADSSLALPCLEKYQGFLTSPSSNGIVSLGA